MIILFAELRAQHRMGEVCNSPYGLMITWSVITFMNMFEDSTLVNERLQQEHFLHSLKVQRSYNNLVLYHLLKA